MSERKVTLVLVAIFILGAAARLFALALDGPQHPDEFFQYLEPAWRHLTGAGVETWEWRRGVRSWALPGYNGSWMALLFALGVLDGVKVVTLMRLHWALLSLALVWAGWRGGLLLARGLVPPGNEGSDAAPAGWQGGVGAALLCALFPLLARFSVHTLSELAATLCLVVALVMTGELATVPAGRGKAVWTGVLYGLGVGLRVQYAPLALVGGLWLLTGRRFRQLGWVMAASLAPVLMFGIVDRVTWHGFFASYVRYVEFNLFEGGAASFGTLPITWYGSQFLHRLPYGFAVLALAGLLGIRASWPFLSAALGVLVLHTVQPHKEERFLMLFWPLALIAAGGCIGAWAARASSEKARWPRAAWLRSSVAGALILGILLDGALHCRGNDFDLPPARYPAQAWVGHQPDVTGLLYDEPLYVGGYAWFGRTVPQVQFQAGLLANPIFSHVLVGRDSDAARTTERAGFSVLYTSGDFVILRRQ